MASISQNGSVLVANGAFSAFVTGMPNESVEGTDLMNDYLNCGGCGLVCDTALDNVSAAGCSVGSSAMP